MSNNKKLNTACSNRKKIIKLIEESSKIEEEAELYFKEKEKKQRNLDNNL